MRGVQGRGLGGLVRVPAIYISGGGDACAKCYPARDGKGEEGGKRDNCRQVCTTIK